MRQGPHAPDPGRLARVSLTLLTLGGALAMAAALAMPQPTPPDLATFVPALLGASVVALATIHLGHRVRLARPVGVLGISLFMYIEMAATGGQDSVFRHAFLLLLVGAAALLTTAEFVAVTPAVLLAAMLPHGGAVATATARTTADFLDVVVWLLVAATLHAYVRTQRRSTSRLQTSEGRFRRLAEASGDAIFVVDLRTDQLTYANAALCDFLGTDPVAAAARLGDLVHPDDHHHLAAVGSIESARAVLRIRHHSMTWRWMSVVVGSVLDDEGGTTVQGVARDVDAETRARDALAAALADRQAALDELRRVDALKSSFLTAISHELRTPLTPIMGMAHTLHASDIEEGLRRELADGILRNARRLTRLLDDVMDVDRLASRDLELKTTPLCLDDLVRREVAAHAPADRTVQVIGATDPVALDAALLGRAVQHLLDNASRHTPPGTPILFEVHQTADDVVLAVEDAGPGIPPELRDAVFEAFVQGPSPDVAVSPGTGIGLSLVRHVAELHGGSAEIDDTVSRGARVVVRLPRTLHLDLAPSRGLVGRGVA